MAAPPDPAVAEARSRLASLTLRDEHRLRRRLDRARRASDPGALRRVAAEIEAAEARVERRRAAVPAVSYPPELPVSARRDDLLAAIDSSQVVVVAGETGSGKTTQLPKLCLEAGRGVRGAIAHTQPRRLAARTVAERIADELGVGLGEAVGYAVRFSDRSSEETLVRLLTDGLLLAEIQRDRALRRYDTIIIDEAHERSLNIDFLLGYLKALLPRRPDLKLLITSATIDPEQFSRHFDDAPIVEVSGRTYPVEVRYRPPDDLEHEELDAIGDAVTELVREGGGDILVFLSGEREIRDTAEVLRGRLGDRVEVLPLYARLSAAEQQRVFKPHGGRRVVLATNVAETSLTVPGIRYVVDPGLARISRYSARLKVQRLPIEPISQASADQRKGRCGRTADGICIRLYGEDDFQARPRFTDPEILRTNLASVILQMAALDLGAVEDFPFLDPPDRRQVRDGIALLQELGALDGEASLTPLGRRLARLPVDPRLGRMVLEADRRGCAEEVIVIAAGLSIQDPRERPADERAAADAQHARFADESSDFLAYLNLWRHLRERQRELSGNQFRKRCRAEFLHFLRVREWQDLVAQLRAAAKEAGVRRNQTPAGADDIHVALLSGLLSHVGIRNEARRDYLGARGARFALWPGSALARRPPPWVMVSELVETTRLWGRTAARIDPAWIEPLAPHLVRRTQGEPRWSRRRASAVATERVTLYGLPIVADRTVVAHSREMFIRHALVARDWDTHHEFFAANDRALEEVDALERRARRRDLLVGDDVLYAFFDERLPAEVGSGAAFDRWWREARRTDPDLLTYTHELLVGGGAIDAAGRPDVWRQGDLELELSYRFEPGSAHDGVTVHVPLRVLPQLRATGFDWLVPAFRTELVTTLIRSLPKDVRRALVPVPDVAAEVVAGLRPRRGALVDAVAEQLERVRGVRVARDDFDTTRLPAHLRMTFRVEDEGGAVVAEGDDLDALREQVRPRLRAQLAAASASLERRGLRDWPGGELPRVIALPGTGQAVRGHPALVDEGDSVAVRVLETPGAQAAAMRAGTRRLLLLTVPSPLRAIRAPVSLAVAPHGSVDAALDDALVAAVDALVDEAGGPAWDEAGWRALRAHVAGRLAAKTQEVVDAVGRVLDAEREVRARLESLTAPALQDAAVDVARQLGALLYPGFVAASGAARLDDVERYVRAAARRLERLPQAVAVDRDRMNAIRALEAEYRARLDAWPRGRPVPAALREVRWQLEELRVSQFAQALGPRGQVSAKRIRRTLAEAS
jgi:ATP-dependent helicase HrpA